MFFMFYVGLGLLIVRLCVMSSIVSIGRFIHSSIVLYGTIQLYSCKSV